MSEPLNQEQIALAEAKLKYNQKRYQYEKQKGTYQIRIKPAESNKLRGYYDDYLDISRQNLLPIVKFHEFVMQYTEIGWLNARDKLKGK